MLACSSQGPGQMPHSVYSVPFHIKRLNAIPFQVRSMHAHSEATGASPEDLSLHGTVL